MSNLLRGVVYTNMRVFLESDALTTVAGKLVPVSGQARPACLVFEIEEKVEGEELRPGQITSFTVDRYQQDFSALVSFFLQVTCSPDSDLVKRLTSQKRGLATVIAPGKLIRRVFDAEVFFKDAEAKAFIKFVEQLVGLERRNFLAVMRAIRTYVTAMHRMADDLELAYTLIVAAMESFTSSVGGFQTTWQDLEDGKRAALDEALVQVEDEVAETLRALIIKDEHLKIRRKFKEFTVKHLPQGFFLDDSIGCVQPMGRQELLDGLDYAYQLRSKYVHELSELPHELTSSSDFSETATVEHQTALTFQGLSRLARAVIVEFVERQPTVTTEPYDYLLETGSVAMLPMAASWWMSNLDQVRADNGRKWLEGFMEQLTQHYLAPTSYEWSNLPEAMSRVEPLLPTMKTKSRLAYVALYIGVHLVFAPEYQRPNAKAVIAQWQSVLDDASVEALMIFVINGQAPHFSIDEHMTVLDAHLASRSRKSGYRLPKLIDAAMSLDLIERLRAVGDINEAERRAGLLREAFPRFPQLRTLAPQHDCLVRIDWKDWLLPPNSSALTQVDSPNEAKS